MSQKEKISVVVNVLTAFLFAFFWSNGYEASVIGGLTYWILVNLRNTTND